MSSLSSRNKMNFRTVWVALLTISWERNIITSVIGFIPAQTSSSVVRIGSSESVDYVLNTRTNKKLSSRLFITSEPLAVKGDWSAYLDEERTGLIYYFNGKTGESVWEPPTSDFPPVSLSPDMKTKAQVKQEEYIQKMEQPEIRNDKRDSTKDKERKPGFFSSLLSDDKPTTTTTPATETQQTNKKQSGRDNERLQNDWFSSVFDEVIQPKEKKRIKEPASEERMKSDFFDRMFSSGRDIVRGMAAGDDNTSANSATDQSFVTDEKEIQVETLVSPQKKTEIPVPIEISVAKPVVETASFVLPHPAKVRWGGEDAVFVRGRTFGVFDGVSGATKTDGIPLYSKLLASEMEKQITVEPNNLISTGLTIPQISKALLQAAEVADVRGTGASTAIVASITTDGFLRVLNVGDSGCIVIRNNRIVARAREISHYFECPYQLSKDSPDRPKDGTKLNIELSKGDIVFMASDGVFDNLPEATIVEIIRSIAPEQSSTTVTRNTLQIIAKRIAEKTRRISLDNNAITPYAKLAKRNGDGDYSSGLGGKVDDVSCVLAIYQ